MSVTQRDMKPTTLSGMEKSELQDTCEKLEIEYKKTDTNEVLRDLIRESGKWVSTKETGGMKPHMKDGKLVHPKFGEYIKVIIHPTEKHNNETSVFASIGLYTAEFPPHEEVTLPIGIVKFLKSASIPQHVYDATAVSENGNIGAHLTKQVSKYVVEVVSDILKD